MAEEARIIIDAQLQFRHDSEAAWLEHDPVLKAGEPAYTLGYPDRFKLGDGQSKWSELPYIKPGEGGGGGGGSQSYESLTWSAIKGLTHADPAVLAQAFAVKQAYNELKGLIPALDDYYTKAQVDAKIPSLAGYATQTFVNTAIANLINGAPTTLDTLKEIADALADNADVVEALESAIGTKADKTTVEALDTRLDSAEANISTNSTNITAQGKTIASHTTSIGTLTSDVNGLKTSVSDLEDLFDSDGKALKAVTADNASKLNGQSASYYATAASVKSVSDSLANYALKTRKISAGTGLTGGGDLTADRTLSLATSGVTAGTYTKTTVDAYGRVTGGTTLSASDIPALAISKITNLQTTLDGLRTDVDNALSDAGDNAAAIETLTSNLSKLTTRVSTAETNITNLTNNKLNKSVWDSVFEIDANGNLKVKVGLYSPSFITARASDPTTGGGGGGGAFSLYTWTQVKAMSAEVSGIAPTAYALKQAYNEIGVSLDSKASTSSVASLTTRVASLESKATSVSVSQTLTTGTEIGKITIDGVSKALYAPSSIAWGSVTGKPSFATVATSGKYSDLSGLPTIPSAVTESTVSGWGFTKNAGTITGIKMNGASKGTSGVVDLGTVITAHQSLTHLLDKTTAAATYQTIISATNKIAYANISGTPTSLPASDVYAWAKAATKPSYTAAEVGALPTSGGTITGDLQIRNNSGESTLLLATKGRVYCDASGLETILYNGGGGYPAVKVKADTAHPIFRYNTVDYALIHSGNIGSQSVNYATSAGNAGSANILSKAYVENINYSAYTTELKLIKYNENWEANGFPFKWTSGLSVMAGYSGWQLVTFGGNADTPYFRKVSDSGTWSSWRTLAFTDSNVASADYATSAGNANALKGISANNYAYYLPAGNGAYLCFNINDHTLAPYGQGDKYIEYYDNDAYYNSVWGWVMAIHGFKGNADSATKLATARTIWGQSFDGTGNVSGNLALANAAIVGGSGNVNMLYFDTSNTLYLGYGMNGVGGSVICGEAIAMRYGGSRTMGFILNSSGNVLIGTTTDSGYKLDVAGVIHSNTGIFSEGYVSARGADSSSDRRLKDNIAPLRNALNYVLGTNYVSFDWKDTREKSIGIIAQEEMGREWGCLVQKHSETYSYLYGQHTALLGAAIQEEDKKVEELKAEISRLKAKVNELETRLNS